MIIHTVSSGETVISIARTYGVPPSQIIQDNELALPEKLTVGQTLVITQPTVTHTVRNGDSLSSIARDYGVASTNSAQQLILAETMTYTRVRRCNIIPTAAARTALRQRHIYPFINRCAA